MPLEDRRVRARAAADRIEEVAEVHRVEVGRGSHAVDLLLFGPGSNLAHLLPLGIVDGVAVTAADYDRAILAVEAAAVAGAVGAVRVTRQPLPGDGLAPFELARDGLGIGCFPVVLEVVVAPSGRRDPHRIVDAERPSAEIDRVRAVVPRLARAPVPEPMPVVVDDIVAVEAPGRRALPEVVVEPARDRRFLAAAYRAAVTRIPGAPIIHAPDCSASRGLNRLDHTRPGTALAPHLDDAAVLRARLDQHLPLARVVAAWLLDVDVLAGRGREQTGGRVPVVGSRNHERVELLLGDNTPHVAGARGSLAARLGDGRSPLGDGALVDVADPRDLGPFQAREPASQRGTAAVGPHDGQHHAIRRGCRAAHGPQNCRRSPGCKRAPADEFTTIQFEAHWMSSSILMPPHRRVASPARPRAAPLGRS